MFWGKESLPKIAKKHHTVSSFCSNVDDLRLRKTWDNWMHVEHEDAHVSDSHHRGRPEGTTTNYAEEDFTGEREEESRVSLIESDEEKRASYDNFGIISSQPRSSRHSTGSRSDVCSSYNSLCLFSFLI
jgi:hypothetical protein